MKLYYTPGACSLAPHIVACEAGLDVGLVKVDLASKRTEDGGDYLAVNPKGGVPALELDNGEILTEAAVMLQYLAALAPTSGLAPDSGMERWRLLELLNFIATEIHKGFSPLFSPATTPEAREATIAVLSRKFAVLETTLGDRQYLLGDNFTVADAYAFTVLSWGRYAKLDLSPWPGLTALLQRIGGRPGVQAALRSEGLLG